MRHRLVTLAFSHYNEKARWALDYCGVDYDEQRFMPGFSQLGVMVATRGRGGRADAVSSRYSTPILITRDGEHLCDSTAIARWASATRDDDPLFPTTEVGELVEYYGRRFGPHTRLAAYWHAFRNKSALPKIAAANVGRAQALAFRALAPLGSALIRRGLKIDATSYEHSLARVREEIAATDRRLEGRSYLVGDRFTAADLTWASLIAPVMLITPAEGYGAVLPAATDFPADTQELVAEVRASRSGAFALEMFRRHRRSQNN